MTLSFLNERFYPYYEFYFLENEGVKCQHLTNVGERSAISKIKKGHYHFAKSQNMLL
jgi:hypothetical protein